MPAGAMVPRRLMRPLPMPLQPKNGLPSPRLSLAPPMGFEPPFEVTQSVDSDMMKSREDDLAESKSSSDNQDGASGEEQDPALRRSKKRYHRHTQHQIQEMERLFKECPHPDEKARLQLSRDLNLDPRQVKFWFQNKRTQMKAQHERHDNSYLRNENEKLKSENLALREAIRKVVCPSCGGPAGLAEMSVDEQQLRVENSKLREEVTRISALATKHLGRPLSSFATATPSSSADAPPILPANEPPPPGPSVADIASRPLGLTDAEKPMVVELAVSAMEELAQVAQAGGSLWSRDPYSGTEILDDEEYLQRFPRVIGPTPLGLKIEATRETELVMMHAPLLLETLMAADRWTEMFSTIIARSHTVEVLSNGVASSYDGAMQLMYAELQLPSPMVPTREIYFLRYSKLVDHLWVVVDVSVDSLRGNPPPSLLRCRKRPSGCVIEVAANGYSKVTWVEHMEVDDKGVYPSDQPLVNSGFGFGAQRWLATLQRQCERIASLVSTNVSGRDAVLPNPEGRRSLLKLAERMTNNFCGGVSASAAHTWITLSGAGSAGADDCRVVIRKSVDDPGRPPGIVLSAATSLWLPVSPARVFQFLRDERYRTEWDILSNMGVVEEMVHVPKGQDPGNAVSLLRVNAVSSNQSNMLILQDCCTDKSCSLVIYAPVDIAAMGAVLNGGDPDAVLLLPSGFAILPDGSPAPLHHRRGLQLQLHDHHSSSSSSAQGSGSLLTVAFQILVDHVPTAKLSLESVATVNNLISSTVLRIRGALSCDNA